MADNSNSRERPTFAILRYGSSRPPFSAFNFVGAHITIYFIYKKPSVATVRVNGEGDLTYIRYITKLPTAQRDIAGPPALPDASA